VGAPRLRDVELVQMVANLVTALQGKPQQDIGITSASAPLDDNPGRRSAGKGVG
jgi:transcription-repair coupling factor (superfamily II helicase)